MSPGFVHTDQSVGSSAITGMARSVVRLYSANPGPPLNLARVELVRLGPVIWAARTGPW